MGTYFSDVDLRAHIDQHRRPEPREFSIRVDLGDQSADFTKFAHLVEHGLLVYRRAYFIQASDLDADATDYWTLKVVQRDAEGREITLGEFDGSKRGIEGETASRIPASGSVNKPLQREQPIFITGTKSGSPSSTDDFVVQIVLALR